MPKLVNIASRPAQMSETTDRRTPPPQLVLDTADVRVELDDGSCSNRSDGYRMPSTASMVR
jgi:hypothetical protein